LAPLKKPDVYRKDAKRAKRFKVKVLFTLQLLKINILDILPKKSLRSLRLGGEKRFFQESHYSTE
jgi:hypothetical protein